MSSRTSSPRRIAFLGPAFPYRGGIAQFIERMASGLRKRGHSVKVFTFTRQYPSLLFPGSSQLESDSLQTPELEIERVLDSIQPLSWRKTAKEILRFEADVVLIKYWTPFLAPAFGFVVRWLRRKGISTIAIIDNAIPHESSPIDRLLSRFLLSACKTSLVMSDSVERDLRKINVQIPVERIYHPVYDHFGDSVPQKVARGRLGIPDDVPVLLFFGFIRRYKGLDILLRAWPTVTTAIPEAHLVIAGEFYQDESAIRDQLAVTSKIKNVRLIDEYIPMEMVAELFGAADVVVQPYRSATQSGVAQIAYNFDRPVITTNVGGLAEIVPDGVSGLVVDPENPDALATAIITFYNSDLKERLTDGVRNEKRKYSWDHIFEITEHLI